MVHLITSQHVNNDMTLKLFIEKEKKKENGSGHCQYIFSFPFKIDNLNLIYSVTRVA